MDFVHSFWSKPLLNNKFNDLQISLAVTLINYAMSFTTIKLHGYKVILYTDKVGAKILSAIPYDEVVILENTITDNYHFAASFKFCALENMSIEDILVDGDAFFTKGKVYGIIEGCKSDILCSFYEDNEFIKKGVINGELLALKLLNINFDSDYKVPEFSQLDGWYNTSVMKFNNSNLKDEYINLYKKNIKLCEELEYNNSWPDVYLEQYHLTLLIKNNNYTVSTLTKGVDEESNLHSLNIGFTHLGAAKLAIQNSIVLLLYLIDSLLVLDIEESVLRLLKELPKLK